MRRPLSLISAAVLAATSLVGLSQTPVSANSINETTITRTTDVGPSGVPNAKVDRIVPISGTGKFLVIGRDSTNQFAQMHLWRLNADLTIDSTFTTRDLGADFAYPAADIAASLCVNQNRTECLRVDNFIINETADLFLIGVNRNLRSPANQNVSMTVTTLVTGKLSTGEILTNTRFLNSYSGIVLSDWAPLNALDIGRDVCTSATGAAVGGISLERGSLNTWSMAIRPDGSLMTQLMCDYSNFVWGQTTSVTEYTTNVLLALKASGSSLVIDTSFGTNGATVLFNDQSKCLTGFNGSTTNNGLKMNNATDVYIVYGLDPKPRTTTVPSFMSSQGVTSYNGCNDSWNLVSEPSQMVAINVQGTVINTEQFPSGHVYRPFRWVIDPQGRWNTILRGSTSPSGPNATFTNTMFLRLDRTGKFDTTMGPSGMKDIQSLLATSVTVNGAQIRLNYSINGFVTTATGIMFTGFASVSDPESWSCSNNGYGTAMTRTFFPYYVTPDQGLVTTFGTNGIGEGVPIIYPIGSPCDSTLSQFISPRGQHTLLAVTSQSGSQPAGIMLARFGAAQGVTGGGDGSGEVASAATTRTDTKVYSRKLPTTSEVNTSLNVLTKKMSRTQMLRTRTPKVCVNLTTSVVLVNSGTCRLEVVNKSSNSVVRTLSTRVRTAESTVGTTVAPQDAIRFAQVSRRLSRTARTQITELAEAASEARRVIIVGHSAGLTENRVSNNRIALQRAAAVKSALQAEFKKAGVKVPISITSVGPDAPATTKKTNSAQARNRRVEIFIVP